MSKKHKKGGRTTPKLSKRCVFCDITVAVDHLQNVTIPGFAARMDLSDEDQDYAHRLATSIQRDADALHQLLVDHGLTHG
jgi:hypothetical protein